MFLYVLCVRAADGSAPLTMTRLNSSLTNLNTLTLLH